MDHEGRSDICPTVCIGKFIVKRLSADPDDHLDVYLSIAKSIAILGIETLSSTPSLRFYNSTKIEDTTEISI